MAKNLKKQKNSPGFEAFMVAFAIIEPLTTLPQIYDVFTLKDAHAVSLLTWVLSMGSSSLWLIYGARIRSWPLIASSVMWLLTELVLVIGILLYS